MRITMMDENSAHQAKNKLTDQVLNTISDWIMDGKLNMGDRLNANEIAQQLGVSRMPVREALYSLAEKGLAESIPYSGMRLVKLSSDDIREIYIARRALEPVSAKYACLNICDTDIEKLKEIHEVYKEIVNSDHVDPKKVYEINRLYHFSIYRLSELNRINSMIEGLWDSISFFKLMYGLRLLDTKTSKLQMINEHQSYLNALTERNPDGIYRLMSDTLQRRIENIPMNNESYQEYADGHQSSDSAEK